MTPTVFITEETWEKSTPHIVKVLRSTDPIVADNTQWWMLEVFDGFGPHTSSFKPMQYRTNNKIITVKEEGYSPHFNQAYDKFAEKSNNAAKKESLPMLFGTTLCINRAGVYQWGLLHAGLFAINGMKE